MARRRLSYAWALDADASRLTRSAAQGLAYARRLAEDARERSREALFGPRFPLTPAELAREEWISESTVRRKIAQARFELYGTLSDSGIYYRRALERELLSRPRRTCKAPDCENELPRAASRRRAYCHPRCRRRHFYQRQHPEAKLALHLRGPREKPLSRDPDQLERVLAFLDDYERAPEQALRRARKGKYRASGAIPGDAE